MIRNLLLGLGLLVAQTVLADTLLGEINVELRGNVVDFTCVAEGSDSDKTVNLGRWPINQLRPAGSTTSDVSFTLKLTGCPPGSASITFSGKSDSRDTSLLALNDSSLARNVAVEILDSDGTRLPLQQASREVMVNAQGDVTLQFYARYISMTDMPEAGSANADATFQINYY